MSKRQKIIGLIAGEQVQEVYLLQAAEVRITKSGRPFLSAVLADSSGTIPVRVWDYTGNITPDDAGTLVFVTGEVSRYRDQLQIVADGVLLLMADETEGMEMSDFIPTAPIDVTEALSYVENTLLCVEDEDYRTLCLAVFQDWKDAFCVSPAAKSIHHAFLSGLLMHTAHIMELAADIARVYQNLVDYDLLACGAFLHDIGKLKEFDLLPIGLVKDYSTQGQLMGHAVLGLEIIHDKARELGINEEKELLLKHMLLSHHGMPEYGAAVTPGILEAELLYHLDCIDSRTEIYREAMASIPAGKFSDYIYALGKRVYRHGMDTPQS